MAYSGYCTAHGCNLSQRACASLAFAGAVSLAFANHTQGSASAYLGFDLGQQACSCRPRCFHLWHADIEAWSTRLARSVKASAIMVYSAVKVSYDVWRRLPMGD